jgi:hypothetical protein
MLAAVAHTPCWPEQVLDLLALLVQKYKYWRRKGKRREQQRAAEHALFFSDGVFA